MLPKAIPAIIIIIISDEIPISPVTSTITISTATFSDWSSTTIVKLYIPIAKLSTSISIGVPETHDPKSNSVPFRDTVYTPGSRSVAVQLIILPVSPSSYVTSGGPVIYGLIVSLTVRKALSSTVLFR